MTKRQSPTDNIIRTPKLYNCITASLGLYLKPALNLIPGCDLRRDSTTS
jgi:hypothetical protein